MRYGKADDAFTGKDNNCKIESSRNQEHQILFPVRVGEVMFKTFSRSVPLRHNDPTNEEPSEER